MKTENEFNAWLGNNIRKLEPHGFFLLKVAEKYHIGISDFFIWHGGSCAAIETKFVREMPKKNGKVLKHEFDGKQVTFLHRVANTGNPAWGLVAIHEKKKIVAVPYRDIPADGNWCGDVPDNFRSFKYDEIPSLLKWVFGGYHNWGPQYG